MKWIYLLLMLLIFGACKKKNSVALQTSIYKPPQGKMIATIKHSVNGQFATTDYYFYELNRPFRHLTVSGGGNKYSETYTYQTGIVTIHRFENNNALPSFCYFTTNDLASGYLQPTVRSDKRIYNEANQLIFLQNFTISNGLTDSSSYYYDEKDNCTKSITKTQSGYTITYNNTYYDTSNTISDKNMGVYWTGKQNSNLLKVQKIVYDYTWTKDSIEYQYSYELNSDGTVKKQTYRQLQTGLTITFEDYFSYYEE